MCWYCLKNSFTGCLWSLFWWVLRNVSWIPSKRYEMVFWNPASLVDRGLPAYTLLTLTVPFPYPINSIQQHFLKIISYIHTCLQVAGSLSHICNQITVSERLLSISWTILKKQNCFCASLPEVLSFLSLCQMVLYVRLWESCFIIQGRKMNHSDCWLLHQDSKFGVVFKLPFYSVLLTNYLLLWWYRRSILYLCHLELANYINQNFGLTLLRQLQSSQLHLS